MESSCEFDVSLIVDGKPQKVPASMGEVIQGLDYLSVPQNCDADLTFTGKKGKTKSAAKSFESSHKVRMEPYRRRVGESKTGFWT